MHKAFLIIGGCFLIMAGLFIPATATLVTMMLPESSASSVRVLPGVTDPRALPTEVEKIQSKSILLQVITNLNLHKIWAAKFKEENDLSIEVTYALLRSRIEVRPALEALLIEIKVFSDDKNEAAAIANEIARVYKDGPLAARSADGKSAVQVLEKAEPGMRPVRPNKPLNIAIGCGLGGILLAVGIALLLLARRGSPRSGPPELSHA